MTWYPSIMSVLPLYIITVIQCRRAELQTVEQKNVDPTIYHNQPVISPIVPQFTRLNRGQWF